MIQQIEISLSPKSRGLTIPITNGHLNMGTWQGIYFCEYRNYGGARKLVATIIGE